jgi:hypothetical protein
MTRLKILAVLNSTFYNFSNLWTRKLEVREHQQLQNNIF